MNDHGLARDIPDAVRRIIRQRCGFGCIICGSAVVQYHHFDPEYKDALEHRAEGITLLCGRCHQKVPQIGVGEIALRNASPVCRQRGFTSDFLFAPRSDVCFAIGSAVFKRHVVVVYGDEVLVGFTPPEVRDGPLRLFARFYDEEEANLLEIIDNEWRAGADVYDVDTTANVLTIRRHRGDISLRMTNHPGGAITIDRLKMAVRGFQVTIESGDLVIRKPGGSFTIKCPRILSTLRLGRDGTVRI